MPKLTIGFSPCPNDTFIFDAMVHGKVDTEGLEFDVTLADVEALNRVALDGRLDITKLSFHAFGHCISHYVLLDTGSALGRGVGPLLVATGRDKNLSEATVAIPGRYTTANFLLQFAFPKVQRRVEMLFSDIEDAVLAGQVDAGVIIHESRFTYAERGLVQLADLGTIWEQQTGMPIPLGGIVVRRRFDVDLRQKINRVLRRSLEYAYAHPTGVLPFVRAHAQTMDPDVMRRHIDLYVNEYSRALGRQGRAAVEAMWQLGREKDIFPPFTGEIFAV